MFWSISNCSLQQMQQQIESFNIANTGCYHDSDRERIMETVTKLDGGQESFQDTLRTQVSASIAESASPVPPANSQGPRRRAVMPLPPDDQAV